MISSSLWRRRRLWPFWPHLLRKRVLMSQLWMDSRCLRESRGILSDINYVAEDFGDYETQCQIDIGTDWGLYLSFVGPAYDWVSGKSIFDIYNSYEEVYEGTFIRNILRISNIVRM